MFICSHIAINNGELIQETNANIIPDYANIRCIDIEEFNSICNATFLDDGKYYETIKINNMSKKEEIMQFASKEKAFGDEENRILQDIIQKNSIDAKNNFFDYYD